MNPIDENEEPEIVQPPKELPEPDEVSEPEKISEPTSAEAEIKAILHQIKYRPKPRKSSLSPKEKARRKKARNRARASRKGR